MLKVRKGYGPSQPNQFVPGIYLNPRVDEGAFGGGLGRSLQQLGGRLQADLEVRKKKESDFIVRKAYADEVLNSQLDLNTRMTEAPLGAEGFTQQVLSDSSERHSAILASLRTQGVSEEHLEDLTIRFGGLQSSMVDQSLNFEERSHIAKVGNDVGEMGVGLSQLALNDPSTMQAAIDEAHGAIDVLGLDAVNAQKLKDETSKTIRMSAAAGLAQQAPDEVVRLLSPSSAADTPTLIRQEEGFRATPYWDVNAYRAGYGSDTTTLADGTVVAIKPGMKVSREDSERDLARRTAEFQQGIMQDVGADQWTGLPEPIRAALTSVAYNYGSLPNSVVRAVKAGDTEGIAASIESLPANKERRGREASLIRSGSGAAPVDGKTGNPVLDALDAAERLQVLSAARTELNRQQVAARGGLATDEGNATAALLSGMNYEGSVPTRDRYLEAYGPAEGEQRWQAFAGVVQTGDFMKDMKTLNATQIAQNLAQMQPTDTASPTFAVEMDSWKAASDAARLTMEARDKDPAQYVAQNYPGIAEMIEADAEPKSVYAQMAVAYEQLGMRPDQQMPYTDSQLAEVRANLTRLAPETRVLALNNMRAEMPEEMFYNGLEQLKQGGLPVEAYGAGLASVSPRHGQVVANVFRGRSMMEANPALKPSPELVNYQFIEDMGIKAFADLAAADQGAILESATALYVASGGGPKDGSGWNPELFSSSLRQVLGGTADDKNTGVVNMSKGSADRNTILPPNTNKWQFEAWKAALTDDDLAAMGAPRYQDGTPVTAEDIIDEGVFVRVAGNNYVVYMGSDDKLIGDADGGQFLFNITEQLVKHKAGLVR